MSDSNNKKLDIIKKIPNINEFENSKIKKYNNWFNKNMVVILLIMFVILGIVIVLLIAMI